MRLIRHKEEVQVLQQALIADRGRGEACGLPFAPSGLISGVVDACLAGLGWGLSPKPLVARHLSLGRLCDPEPDLALDVPLYWQFTRTTAAAIAPLNCSIRTAAAKVLLPPS